MNQLSKPFLATLVLIGHGIFTAQGQSIQQAPLTDWSKLKDGDLVFIKGSSERTEAIQKLTKSQLTHCGIVFQTGNGKWIVYEGAGNFSGNHLDIDEWQKHETGTDRELHPLYAKRVSNFPTEKLAALKVEAEKLHNTHYDFGFAWENSETVDRTKYEFVYCSELIWKAFRRASDLKLGNPHPLKDYYEGVTDPTEQRAIKQVFERVLNSDKSKLRRGGHDYNPEELAISPKEIFESDKLTPVTD